eukprot:COSAG01_NODE_4923_length_4615_cov_3.525232_3_plen_55_part_00
MSGRVRWQPLKGGPPSPSGRTGSDPVISLIPTTINILIPILNPMIIPMIIIASC